MQWRESAPALGAGRGKDLRRRCRGISEEATSGAYVWVFFLLSGSCLLLAFLWEELWIRGLWVG